MKKITTSSKHFSLDKDQNLALINTTEDVDAESNTNKQRYRYVSNFCFRIYSLIYSFMLAVSTLPSRRREAELESQAEEELSNQRPLAQVRPFALAGSGGLAGL